MSDLMSIGMSGLLAYRKGLDTAGHNIANVDTAGYSRQRLELVARPGGPAGDGVVGAGVTSSSVQRLTDALITGRVQGDASAWGRIETYAGLSTRVDALLSDADAGLSPPLQSFHDALGSLAADPASTAARQAVLGSGASLAERFQALQAQLDGLDQEINQRLAQTATEVTQFSQRVAELNDRINLARAQAGGQPPNDLLDQRDQLIKEIATRVGISTTTQEDGSINVFTSSGQALVLGREAGGLRSGDDAFGHGRQDLYFSGGQNLTAQLRGGILGGLLDFRREVLDPARSELGRLAAGVALAVNAQHAAGVDARGNPGGDFFAPLSASVAGARSNSGAATVSATLVDAGALSGEELMLTATGSGWRLSRVRDGSAVPFTGSGSSADPIRAEGLSLVIGGAAPAAGDRFLLRPTASAAGQMRLAIGDPQQLAAATPLRVSAALGNSGNARVQDIHVDDAGHAALRQPASLEFTDAGHYRLNGGEPIAWTPGTVIRHNGWALALSGTPAAGDRFELSPMPAGSSDNGNARQLAALSTRGILDGGTRSLSAAQGGLVARVGAQAQQADLQQGAVAAVRARTEAEQQSVSGVNLDEEAANLLRFQQAYQAAARIIAVAGEVFQTLLEASRR